jgi:hypothetical protein
MSSYNRSLRTACVLLVVLVLGGLGACKKAPETESVRQAVLDRLSKAGMALDTMDVSVTHFEPKGDEGEATISLKLKDSSAAPMTFKYRMQRKDGKWVATGLTGGGGPHSGGAPPPMPPAGNPHGGSMPSPEDLPPTGKAK